MNLKKIVFGLAAGVGLFAGLVQASPYNFTSANGSNAWLNVDYWTGSGDCETILVIDWNNAGDWVSPSHAFGYRWDGSQTTEAEMLSDICDHGGLDMTTGYGGAFIYNFYYTDSDGDHLAHTEEGSWNLASTDDVNAQWGDMSGDWTKLGDWDANMAGIDNEYIANGLLEGINLMWWFDSSKTIEPLTVPFAVPEPATIGLILIGGLFGFRRKASA